MEVLKSKLHKILVIVPLILSLLAIVSFWVMIFQKPLNVPKEGLVFEVSNGDTLNKVVYSLHARGVLQYPKALKLLAVISAQDNKIQVGEYKITPGMSANKLLDNLVSGKVIQYGFTIVEGWHFKQMLAALQEQEKIKVTLPLVDSEDKKMVELTEKLEGLFWPNTYFYTANTTDTEIIERANAEMLDRLDQLWNKRSKNIEVKTAYEAVILASIIEKESSLPDEYEKISGVYHRRLAKNIRLQADPTVIYGLMKAGNFNPPLLRGHLRRKNPYNTYRNLGLPPTPIAIPSQQALYAALHPDEEDNLYFVADGNGGHVFTSTLSEHNEAVQSYRNSR